MVLDEFSQALESDRFLQVTVCSPVHAEDGGSLKAFDVDAIVFEIVYGDVRRFGAVDRKVGDGELRIAEFEPDSNTDDGKKEKGCPGNAVKFHALRVG